MTSRDMPLNTVDNFEIAFDSFIAQGDAVSNKVMQFTKSISKLHKEKAIEQDNMQSIDHNNISNGVTNSVLDQHIIHFDNFTMVPFDPESKTDYEDYKAIVTDDEIMKTVSLFDCRSAKSEEEIESTFKILTEANRISMKPLSYKVIKKTGELMGFIMAAVLEKNQNGEPEVLDFGYMFKKEYRGTVPLIVSSVMAKQSFSISSVQKIIATAISDNHNSQAIILRRGFEYVGQIKKDNGPTVNVLELTKAKFLSTGTGIRMKDVRKFIDEKSKQMALERISSQSYVAPFCARV